MMQITKNMLSVLAAALHLAALAYAEDFSGLAAIETCDSHMMMDLSIAAPPPFPVTVWPGEGPVQVNQFWILQHQWQDNTYVVQHVNTHKNLAWTPGDSQVYVAQVDSGFNQAWTLRTSGSTFSLEATGTGQCIGRRDDSKGARIILSKCSGAKSQQWKLVKNFTPTP
ncbi:hypothetical protein BGZ73_001378 [Actinomortierella ambigua]|nr:hypothetical protein BGZ73_001378 [Actinomortierella ambigua]